MRVVRGSLGVRVDARWAAERPGGDAPNAALDGVGDAPSADGVDDADGIDAGPDGSGSDELL